MPIIPLYLLDPVDSSDATLLSQFNFCNSFDDVLPFPTGTVSILDAQHLWGLFIGIAAEVPSEEIIIGPITSQVIFKMNKTIGEIGGSETLGIFREPKDSGRFKP